MQFFITFNLIIPILNSINNKYTGTSIYARANFLRKQKARFPEYQINKN